MKQTVNFDTFYKDMQSNFSFDGARALFDYLEELEDATGEYIEYDPIDLKCSYSEYKNIDEVLEQYDCATTREELEDYTTVIDHERSDVIVLLNF